MRCRCGRLVTTLFTCVRCGEMVCDNCCFYDVGEVLTCFDCKEKEQEDE